MRRLILAGLVVAAPLVALAGGDQKSVQLREAAVRAGPKPFKPLIATLKYADKVDVVAEKDGWSEIRLPDGRTGFIHQSAITEQELTKVAAGGEGTGGRRAGEAGIAGKGLRGPGAGGVTDDEVALAGKGFNPQVEKQYRADHREEEEGFKRVDAMEKRKADSSAVEAFLADGKLGDAGKGQ